MVENEIVRTAEAPAGAVTPAEDLAATPSGQDGEGETFALAFIGKVMRLRGVRVEREQFLTSELRRRGVAEAVIAQAVADRPATAGVPSEILDAIARQSIIFETKKSATLAFAAGLPGGLAMFGTVPADVAQFYVHAFRIMQKLAYLYGWQSLIEDSDEVDDETLAKLGAFLGLMLGVSGASSGVTKFANDVARPALQKQIAKKALSQTTYYPLIKHVLKGVGVQINKQVFARTVTKVVPLVGGLVSGGLTFASLRVSSGRLMQHLRTLPPASAGSMTVT